MCGIAGFTGQANKLLPYEMTDMLIHRGPDADGYYVDQFVNLAS